MTRVMRIICGPDKGNLVEMPQDRCKLVRIPVKSKQWALENMPYGYFSNEGLSIAPRIQVNEYKCEHIHFGQWPDIEFLIPVGMEARDALIQALELPYGRSDDLALPRDPYLRYLTIEKQRR